MKTTPSQLCAYYLDGNDEAAYEVFEHAGPQGLRDFLGFRGTSVQWIALYKAILDEYNFLGRLCQKYRPFMSELIFERGVETFREVFAIEHKEFDLLVARIWGSLLDSRLESTVQDLYRSRRKSHFGAFFVGLRNILRGELGEL